MCKWFFRDATKIQNGRQRSALKNFVGAKTLKLRVRNYSNFTITFPMIWRCTGDFFKVLLEFKMAATDQLEFFFLEGGGVKTQKICLVNFFSNFNITFLATWGCASDFLKFYWNSKWPPWINFIFFVGAKTEKLKSVIIHIVQSHYPPSGNVYVILLKN